MVKLDVKNTVVPFLIGGTIIAGVKFASANIDNPAIAAAIAGVPIGLISIFFVASDKSEKYAHNYFYVTMILLASIALFYTLIKYTKINKNVIVGIALGTWMTLILLRYWYTESNKQ
jgi:hypothetical protein